MIYKDLKALCAAMSSAVDKPEQKLLDKLQELTDVYWLAHEEAHAHGYVGVGCITYAEEALQRYQEERVSQLKGFRGDAVDLRTPEERRADFWFEEARNEALGLDADEFTPLDEGDT